MNVLIINCGSSSLKYQLIDSETEQVQAKGLCERIGIDGRLIYQPAGGEKEVTEAPMPTHTEAIQMVLDALVNAKTGVMKSLDEVDAIGHRVLHGGAKITESCVIDQAVVDVIEECCDLGPLHNPANLKGIYACQKLMPGKPNVAVFDTAFHQTMPTKAFMYGLPYEYYEKYHIRKYGFHGTSHSFVSKETIKFLGLDADNSKVIVCHLGNGASISAVKNGKCVDTSMGLTPLEGLVMGTRSGDIDPAVVEYICNKENKTVSEMLNILNKKSGVFGLTKGLSSDFRDLEEAMADGNQLAADAIDIFCYRVAKIVGSYVAAMNGVDAIAFTAGIGENAPLIREKVCEYLGYLGVKIDAAKNNSRGKEVVISADDSAKKVAVVPTNEELAIMRETVALVK
ncbi:acetate kinase [Qiania dongpingensis]|uniref:Acetate kinase n=1 Tax=Qiania dongpingensis TaxID=2763669 RepID=A0A7G9G3R3_9FIRM|nr:acetate kinase [Qiania dongpingensis]QNM05445.1 acetate kinase [Qiania dongpingensis]